MIMIGRQECINQYLWHMREPPNNIELSCSWALHMQSGDHNLQLHINKTTKLHTQIAQITNICITAHLHGGLSRENTYACCVPDHRSLAMNAVTFCDGNAGSAAVLWQRVCRSHRLHVCIKYGVVEHIVTPQRTMFGSGAQLVCSGANIVTHTSANWLSPNLA